jgi:anti-sigma regulatory factor (Ser/Thr protein kinase)
MKKTLIRLGVNPLSIKRAAIAMYEAEINAVIHGNGGIAVVYVYPDSVKIEIIDQGPGIHDLDKAMTEGYSTAPDSAREMGFGAGMGLPNMKKHVDKLEIDTEIGKGTKVTMYISF